MANEAALWVEIVPTTKGIKGKVESEFSAGFDAVEKRGAGLWQRIGSGVKGLATTAVGVLGAAVAKSVGGGLSRLLNIEDARAKLLGLGNDVSTVDAIMSTALASVKGTAFGLDEAATVAAGAVAAGIRPGEQLESVLKTIADTATIAGASMVDTGEIFDSVAARGKLQGDDLMQLQTRGVPVLQFLAKHYGITAQAASDMVSRGQVDFENFAAAMQENLGGAALQSGNTASGAFKNMLASLSRIGANLLGGVFPLFQRTFAGITNLLAPVEDKAKLVGDAIGRYVVPAFDRLQASGGKILEFLKTFQGIVGPLAGGLAALGIGGLGGLISQIPILGQLLGPLGGVFTALSGPIGILAGAFAGLLAISPELRAALGDALTAVQTSMGQALRALAPSLGALGLLIADLAQAFGAGLAQAIELVTPSLVKIVDVFGELLSDALPIIIPLVSQLAGVALQLLHALLPIIPALLTALLPAFTAMAGVVLKILAAVAPLVSMLAAKLLPILTPLIAIAVKLLDPLLQLLTPLLELIGFILPPLIDLLTRLIGPILDAAAGILNDFLPAIDDMLDMLSGVTDFLTGVFTGDWDKAWRGLANIAISNINSIIDIAQGVVNGVIDLVNALIDQINSVVGLVTGITSVGIAPLAHVDFSGAKLSTGAGVPQPASSFREAFGDRVPSTLAAPGVNPGDLIGAGAGLTINQTNNFASEDPQVAVNLTTKQLDQLERQAPR